MKIRHCLFLFLLLPVLSAAEAFDPGKASFSLSYKDETSPYRINAVFLMPGETLDLKVRDDDGSFSLRGPAGDSQGGEAWKWLAPREPGLYPLRVIRESPQPLASPKPLEGSDTVLLNAFVMTPATAMQGEYLETFRIGSYPKRPLKGLRFYRNPEGYIRVDSNTAQAQISPHFTLGQFLCKQSRELPAFLVLRERLVLKLEAVLEEVNKSGHSANTFHVMSGYRTPYYNRSLGNVKHSAHQFGGAADIFIDANPVDGDMDDLNGDGRSDREDSAILFKIVDRMALDKYYLPYLGGIGTYNRNNAHGPFVHVDVRGFRAIW